MAPKAKVVGAEASEDLEEVYVIDIEAGDVAGAIALADKILRDYTDDDAQTG